MRRRMLLASLSPAARVLVPLGGLSLAACSSLDGYTTAPGESYCGAIVASGTFSAGLPAGFAMRLTLDAAELDGDISPGAVWASPDPSGPASTRLLDGAPLRRIPALENDPLSTPDLGGGRAPTRIFALTPASAAEDPLLGVLSLRSDGGAEVRLLRPGVTAAPPASPPPGKQPLFALFVLYKQAGTCAF
jgi:hypothetical protein